MAEYAAALLKIYRRVEAIAEIDETMLVLDLTQHDLRKAVAQTLDIADLYRSKLASDCQ